MAELHIIGQISSAKYFKQSRLLCKWIFYIGKRNKIIFINRTDSSIYQYHHVSVSSCISIVMYQIFVIIIGNGWKIISGSEEGQTQESCDFYTNNPVWDHPIDLHYTTQTLQNSPKLLLQVFCRDNHGRLIFLSYGVYNVPLSPGSYILDCHTWKPIGTFVIYIKHNFITKFIIIFSIKLLCRCLERQTI